MNMTCGQFLIVPPRRIVSQPWDTRMSSRRSIRSPDLYSGQVTQSSPTLGNYGDSSFLSLGWSPVRGKDGRASFLTQREQQPYPVLWVSFLHWKTGKSCFSLSATQFLEGTWQKQSWVCRVFGSCLIFILSWFWFLAKTGVYFWSCFFCWLLILTVHEAGLWLPSLNKYFCPRHWGSSNEQNR